MADAALRITKPLETMTVKVTLPRAFFVRMRLGTWLIALGCFVLGAADVEFVRADD